MRSLKAGILALVATATLLSQNTQQAPAEPAKPKKASIEGKVVNAVTGDALKKTTLMLAKSGGAFAPVSAETDAAGTFVFKDLEPGEYTLMGERQGFARQSYGSRRGGLAGGTPLRVGAGEEVKGIVFKLQAGGVVAGRVLDADGDPVANATVACLQPAYSQGKRQMMPVGGASTNDAGEYRIASLGQGKYYLSATYREPMMGMAATSAKPPADKPAEGYTTTYYPGVLEPGGATGVDVAPGAEVRGLDITLVKTPVVRVSGKLPVEQPAIIWLAPKGAGISGMMRRGFALAQPPEGKFEFKNVPPGTYVLSATSPQDQRALGAQAVIDVADKNIDNVQLTTGTAAEIAGAILFDKNSEQSARGIQVILIAQDMLSFMPPRATAGEDGKFTLKDVISDRYTVTVTGVPEGSYVKAVRFGGRDATEGFDLTGGAGSLEIVIDLRGARVEGSVTDAESKALAGITVALIPKDQKFSRYRNTSTDQEGRFSLKGVPPGEYKLLAWEDIELNAYQDPEFVRKFDGKAEAVSLDAGGYKSISVKAIPAEGR